MMEPAVYDRFGSPGDRACVEQMRGTLSIMHFHGERIRVDAVPKGVDILHYDAAGHGNPGVRQMTKRFPELVVSSVMPPEGLPDRRFILSSGCAVPLHVGNDELAARVERVREAW